MSKKYWKYWFEKACSFLVSVKMILVAVGSFFLYIGKLSGDNYTTLVLGIISAYGANKVVETVKKIPEALKED